MRKIMENIGSFSLYSFLAIVVLVFLPKIAIADDESGSSVIGIVGVIVDESYRVGKEGKVAIKMALQDFYNTTNQTLILHVRSSDQRDPMHAALAGEFLTFLPFQWLLEYLSIRRYHYFNDVIWIRLL